MLVQDLPKDAIVLLIDADSISYSISHELKKWDDDINLCNSMINDYMTNLLLEVGCSHYVGFLGGKTNFRYNIAKTKAYKANRPEKNDRDKYWQQYINEFLVQHWGLQRVEGIEADDAVSIAHEQLEQVDINHITCSNDKDVDTVPGNHYSMNKRQFYYVDDPHSMFNLFKQLIIGDSTDNIPGLPGKGIKYVENCGINAFNSSGKEMLDKLIELYTPYGNAYFQEQLALIGLLTKKDDLIIEYHLVDKQKLEENKNQLISSVF